MVIGSGPLVLRVGLSTSGYLLIWNALKPPPPGSKGRNMAEITSKAGVVLQKLPNSSSPNAGLQEDSKQSSQEPKSAKTNGEAEKEIIPKQFFWDQLITYLATTIGLLTLLDVTLQFFRATSALVCYVPTEFMAGIETTRDQAAFVNTYCLNSLTQNEYYSVFILFQGVLIVAPHYLWSSIFSGQFDFFFDLVRQIDRLRDSKTGEYRTKNFEILKKLENQFPEKWKWYGIFAFYIAKLIIQALLIATAIVINPIIFPHDDFEFNFECPKTFNETQSPIASGWLLPGPVQCVYSSFRVLSKVQYVDYLLLVLAQVAVMYGLFWCVKRHTSGLGYKEIATFAFTSCLSPSSFVFNKQNLISPRIGSDLDFLLMKLFRADSGHGRVFKDLQVDKELKRLLNEDHEQLALITSIISDIDERVRRKQKVKEDRSQLMSQLCVDAGAQTNLQNRLSELDQELTGLNKLAGVSDMMDLYRKSEFGKNPIDTVRKRLGPLFLGEPETQETHEEEIKSIRNQFFKFLESTSEKYELAYDISFGTIGFALILARTFKQVVSVNFHPFYQNEKEVCRKELFHANYSRITLQNDIFSLSSKSITKFDEALDVEFGYPSHPQSKRQANLIIVGPFMEEAKKATVNLHLQRLYFARYFAPDAFMLAIRPLKIGDSSVNHLFCKYIPPAEMFEEAEIKNIEKPGAVPVMCYTTQCSFEFVLYKFIRKYPPRFIPPRPPLPLGQLPPGEWPPVQQLKEVNTTAPDHSNLHTSAEAAAAQGTNNTTQISAITTGQGDGPAYTLSSRLKSRDFHSDKLGYPLANYTVSPRGYQHRATGNGPPN